jgi:FkbM family methyltransferase
MARRAANEGRKPAGISIESCCRQYRRAVQVGLIMPQERIVEGDVDRLIQAAFFADFKAPGIIVDVGAARPDYLSVSSHFRDLGWRVIAIEPNPEFCTLYRAKGYEIHEFACGPSDQDNVEFQIVNSHGGSYLGGEVSFESFSSFKIKPEYARLKSNLDIATIRVNVRSLNTILREYAKVDRFDILTVDVEGWELEVLQGLDLFRYQPKVIVMENLFGDPKYRIAMKAAGYSLWQHVFPNDIYVKDAIR